MHKRFPILILLMIVLLVGCRRGEISGIQRAPEGGVDLTISLTESDLNEAVADALARMPNPLLRNPQIDVQTGGMVITGDHDRRDGGGTVSGSVTLAVYLVDGKIAVQVTAATIEGLDLSDERVQNFNERLSQSLERRLNRDNGAVTVKSLTLTDTVLEVVVNAQR